jgi:hypothetical protein
MEHRFMADLTQAIGTVRVDPSGVVPRLWDMALGDDGPSLSDWVSRHATRGHVRELAIHRSAYQLKEADPHTWAIPHLRGEAKAALVAIQGDEYGNGRSADMHSSLFANTMAELGLDPLPNRYIDRIPGVTLATTNLISLLGLHRSHRGALVGHLALFEMTSAKPMARYARALEHLGVSRAGTAFYRVHADVDLVHQTVATDQMVAGLLEDEPDLARDVVFGAAALCVVEARFTRHVLRRWANGETSLRSVATGEPRTPG